MKRAGYDFLVIEGKAEEPKYVVIDDSKVEIRPAERLKRFMTTSGETIW